MILLISTYKVKSVILCLSRKNLMKMWSIFFKQNLTMFGIDIVVEKGTGHHVVIDINYFPGESVFLLQFTTSYIQSIWGHNSCEQYIVNFAS